MDIRNKLPIDGILFILLFFFFPNDAFARDSSLRFDDIKIRVGVMDHSAIGRPAKRHAISWEKATGGTVEVIVIPFGELFNNYYDALTTASDRFDVITFASGWIADFSPYLSVLPKPLTQNDSFDDIHKVYRERLMKWGDDWLAITLDGDLFSGYYRKDLFFDKKNQSDFRASYGYQLSAPETWSQYRDIAEFFTGRTDDKGQKLYGTTEAFARGGIQFWNLFSRVSAYANHPDRKGAQFFDPDTMQAQINNPAWIRAVTDYSEIVRYTPPGSLGFNIEAARVPFLKGRTAMILDWGDTAQQSVDPDASSIIDKVGYFMLPGTRQVWDYVDKEWDEMERPHKAPFLAFGGWVGGVVETSKHKEAAFDYLMWYSSPENSLRDVMTSGTGVNPYRYSHFANIDAWTKVFSLREAAEYLGVLIESLDSPNVALDLRLPGFHNYTEALEIELEYVLSDKKSVLQAMNNVAEQWEIITEKRGRSRQLALYRTSMGLDVKTKVKNKFTIGFSQSSVTNKAQQLRFNKEIHEEAAKYSSVELIVSEAQNNHEKQLKDTKDFIEKDVDAIIISPKETEGFSDVLKQASEKGIPVVVLERPLSDQNHTQFIGISDYLLGKAAGKYAIKVLGGEGKAKGIVVTVWSDTDSQWAQDRHKGFQDAIDLEPAIFVISEKLTDTNLNSQSIYEDMLKTLGEHKKIDLVFAHNDSMAFEAHRAAKNEEREKKIAFLGIGGAPEEGIKWVEQGILTATFSNSTPIAHEGIRQVVRILADAPFSKQIMLPTMVIDKNNATSILKASRLD